MIRSLQHVALQLPNPEIARQFYTAFGMELSESQGQLVARCQGREQNQVVVTEGASKGGPLHYLSFGGHAKDMAETKNKLEARGIPLLDPPTPTSPEGLWFRDLDGNLIHLGLEAPARSRALKPVLYNNASAYVRTGQRGCPPFGMDPKPIRLGHVILFSPDPPRQAKFYQETLGMRLSDTVADGMVIFLRGASDGDHHLLGLLKDPTPGLHHASYEMDSVDHMEIAGRRVKEAGYKHVWGTGRHVVGSNMFHYFRDPWGSMSEYFFDIDFIPEGTPWEAKNWSKEQGLFLWSNDGPPPPDFPRNVQKEHGAT